MPWLTTLVLIPAIGAGLLLLVPGRFARELGLLVSLAAAVFGVVVACQFDTHGSQYQLTESHEWIRSFGIGYLVGIDGVALALILLTVGLVPVVLIAGWDTNRTRGYLALTLLLEAMVLASFTAIDIVLFYVFFEAMLIPLYLLIGGYTGGNRVLAARAAMKFLLYNLAGGLVMLAGIIGLYVVASRSGTATFDLRVLAAHDGVSPLQADPNVLRALFIAFAIAFAIKAPMWPVHTWLPDAAVYAPPASAVLMMAVVDKVGTFGLLRYCLQLFPQASRDFAPVLVTLAVISVFWGAIAAIGQQDILRLIAYTSISHFGLIVLGIFAFTAQGAGGSVLYMVNHGIATAALFLIAAMIVQRRNSRRIDDYGGLAADAPKLSGVFLIAGLATISLPGLAPFISEFLVFIGTYPRYPVAAVCASLVIVLAAVYFLWLYQRICTGPRRDGPVLADLRVREVVVVTPLIVALIVLGVFPKPALDIIDPGVHAVLSALGVGA